MEADGCTVQPRKRRFLIVRTENLRWALDLRSVRRILKSILTFPVPGAQPELLGLGQWRGEPLPLLDLHVLLEGGEPSAGNHKVTVVVRVSSGDEREYFGLAVDEAVDVVRIAEDELESTGQGLIVAEAAIGSHLVRVIDLSGLETRA
jgi:chemotaxis signal transduction protein